MRMIRVCIATAGAGISARTACHIVVPQSGSFVRSVALAAGALVEGVAALGASGCDHRGDIIVNPYRLISLGDHSLTRPIPIQVVGVINGSTRIAFAERGRCQLPPVLPGKAPAGIAIEIADGVAALDGTADFPGKRRHALTLIGDGLPIDFGQQIRPALVAIGIGDAALVSVVFAPQALGQNISCVIIRVVVRGIPPGIHCFGQLPLGVIGICYTAIALLYGLHISVILFP